MPSWKKVIVSGSDAVVNSIKIPSVYSNGSVTTGTNVVTIGTDGQLYMTGSYGGGGGGTVFEKVDSPSGGTDICSFKPAFGTNTLSTQDCTTGGRGCNSILYGASNVVHFARNIVGGFENKISGSVADDLGTNRNFSQFNTVFGGQCNTILAGTGETACRSLNNTIIGGCNSSINEKSNCNIIVGGYSNIFHNENINTSAIIGGVLNSISGSQTNTFLFGTTNSLISSSVHTDVGSNALRISGSDGANNTSRTICNITLGTCNTHLGPFDDTTTGGASLLQSSVAIGGRDNVLKGGAFNSIISSRCSEIVMNTANLNCGHSSIVNTKSSKIHHSFSSTILGGCCNHITGSIVASSPNRHNNIIGGCNTCISDSCFSSIISSCDAKVHDGYVSHVIGTRQSCISGSQYSMVVGGFQNCISGSSSDQFNIIGGGCNSIIKGGSANAVIGGKTNHIGITGISNCSTVLGGYNHDINSSTNSQVLGGHTNCIQDGVRSSIIGGCSTTFTDSTNAHAIGLTGVEIADAENTLYAYNICAYGTTGNNGTICAKTGCFSNIEGRSPLSINTGTSSFSITSSHFNVGTSGEMSSGGSDGILTTTLTASSDISSSGTITAPNLINVGTVSNSKITGSFTGSFTGDGSNLTDLPSQNPFPLTASSAAIISRSIAASDTDSTALRLIGSSSISQSGIFEVEGSAGPLFSVQDGLDGVLMEVNNISGLPLFQVSSSNEVFVNRGNLTSGVNTATASFANFSGSFQGDGSNLTNLPAGSTPTLQQVVTAGSSTTVAITGSAISASGTITGQNVQVSSLTSGRVVFADTNGRLSDDSTFTFNSTNDTLSVYTASIDHLVVGTLISASTLITTGSNTFGDAMDDVQTLVGTTKMTGSAQVTGSLSLTGVTNALNFTNTNSTASVSTKLSFRHASGTDYNNLVYFGSNYFRLNNSEYPNAAALYVNGRIQGSSFYASSNGDGFNIASYNSRFTNNYLNLYGSSGVYFGASNAGFATIRDGAAGTPSATYDIDALLGIVSAGNSTGFGFKVHNSDDHETFAVQDNKKVIVSGSLEVSGSVRVKGQVTGSLTVESSGSTVFEVIGSEGTLFSVDDDLDGTIFTANDKSGLPVLEASASGEVYIGKSPQSLYTTAVISSTTAATTQSIFGLSTSSYGGAFFDYTVQSGSDARAGSIMSVWNGSNISFTETTTTDIGDTTDFNVIVHISQSQAQIASHASRAGYNIKTIIRSI